MENPVTVNIYVNGYISQVSLPNFTFSSRARQSLSKMTSLRKKTRGVESLPRRQSAFPAIPEGSVQTLPPPPRVRPMDKSKVESLMKRRYSVRQANPPKKERFPPELGNKAAELKVDFLDDKVLS
jgi:hypothetical protein